MNQPDMLRTIQAQQGEINQLREQLARNQSINFEAKYKKALKEISGIIKANRQLKEELDRLSNFKSGEGESFNKINKEQMGKAYEKILKEKNELLGEKEASVLQNQNLKYLVSSLQDTVTKLKSQKQALARQKQGMSKLNQKTSGGSSDKLKEKDGKEKEAQLRKTLENYEQRNSALQKTNRKLEDQVSELENKIYNLESEYKNKLNQKDIEVKVSRSSAREEFQGQINSLKKEISQLKSTNSQLTARVGTIKTQARIEKGGPNEYEEQLVEALRDLKLQMEPMSAQIAQLQDRNESEREQVQREKANLEIKVMEFKAEVERMRENQKILEQKLLKESDKTRKWEDSQKNIKKLEEENRMLGGRVIVLEAKQVALRNRSGDELEERVLEFQTRVEMLLSDKETIANMKNIGIHQLIALKAYIMELDARLKQVVNENEYAVKKYKSYKQKCTQLIRELKQHDIAINALKGKLQGYDRLVVKLQGELQRAITINDNQMKAINVKITQSTMNSIEIYKKRYESLLEKLSLQEKYAEQEIQTLKLNYDTKILDLNLKLEELSSIRETIGLYKSKNEELSSKLTQKQNELLETKMTKIVITDTVPQSKNPHKETINKLHDTINLKESTIITLQNQIRKTEQEWKGKYSQLEQTANASLSKKSREDEDRKREIQQLENQIRTYRNKISDLESKVNLPKSKSDDESQFKKSRQITGQISDLEVQLEDIKNRYQIEVARTGKLNKANIELKQVNNELQGEVSRLKFEIKRVEKEMQLQLEDKNTEIKRIQSKAQETNLDSSRIQRPQSDTNNFKINSLRMELEMLQGQTEQLEKDKARYYNKSIELEREISQLNIKIEELNYTIERTKSNINNDLVLKQTEKEQEIERLQYNLKTFKDKNTDLEDRMAQYEAEITKLRNELNRERQKLLLENDHREEQITKLTRELNRVRSQISNTEDVRAGIEQEYEYKLGRINNDNISLRDQISSLQTDLQRYESEIRFLKNREMEYNSKSEGQENYVLKLSNDIKQLQNKEIELESDLMEKESIISKLTNELTYIRSELAHIEETIESKDSYISRLTADFNTLKNGQIEWQIQVSSKASQLNKANNDLLFAKSRLDDLEHELESTKTELIRIKAQSSANEQNYGSYMSELQDKDMVIMRLQSDLKSKTQQLHDLEFELSGKVSKVTELQNESIRLRSLSTQFESELMEKNGQISKLVYELNSFKIKYENLEYEHENAGSNWSNVNRELAAIKAQIGNYEDDIQMKNITIERYKNDIKDLTSQIERINEEIFEKNKIINNLNQELFKLRIEGDEKSSDQIYRLENEIYQLKSKVNNLQGQLEGKEEELSRARLEISTVRSNISVNRYTDEEYDLLQAQFFQVQKSLTQVRSLISEKDLEITQLEAKIEYMKKLESQAKRRFSEERHDLQTELQNVLTRERQLRNQINDLQDEAQLKDNKVADDQKWGLHLYQQECDRLQKIVEELQNEVNALKLKMTYMTNQEDRIIQNLTLMTLTFAEVEALRERMKTKEYEISEVRKSLINFASSSEEITSMGSRMLLRQKANTERSKENTEKRDEMSSIEEIERNNYTYQYSQTSYNTDQASKKAETGITGVTGVTGGAGKITYMSEFEPNYSKEVHEDVREQSYNKYYYPEASQPYGQTNFNETATTGAGNRNQFNTIVEDHSSIQSQSLYQRTEGIDNRSGNNYKYEDFEPERNEPNEEDDWQQYEATKTADRKLNELVNSMTGIQKQEKEKSGGSSKQQSQNASQQQSGIYEAQSQSSSGQQATVVQPQTYVPVQVTQPAQQVQPAQPIQTAQTVQPVQPVQPVQTSQSFSQENAQSFNQQFSQQTNLNQSQGQGAQSYQQTTYTPSQFPVPQSQIGGGFSAQQSYPPSQTQPQSQFQSQTQAQFQMPSQGSWRYGGGSSQGSQSISMSVGQQQFGQQGQGQFGQTQVIQQKTVQNQQQVRINVGSSNSIGSSKALSPGLQQSFNVMPGQPQVQQIQYQGVPGVQGRNLGVFQQPLQYPGFAR